MKWNATYSYRPVGTSEFVDGGSCYIEENQSEQLQETEWGVEVTLCYKMYVKGPSRFEPQLSDEVQINMQDGQTFICSIVGIDFTVNRVYTFLIKTHHADVVANGIVSFKTKTAGGIDPVTGYPIATTITWGDDIACRWATIDLNLLANSGTSHFTDAKYVIYVQGDTHPTEQLKLTDSSDNVIGEFSIISYEYIDTRGITKIIV